MDKFVLFRIHLEEHHHDLFHLQEILYALPYFLVEKAKRSLNIWQWNSWRSKKKFRFHPCPNLLQIFKLSWALPAAKLIMKLPGLAKLFANWINLRLKGPKSESKYTCVRLFNSFLSAQTNFHIFLQRIILYGTVLNSMGNIL